jgi:hypothetical protein
MCSVRTLDVILKAEKRLTYVWTKKKWFTQSSLSAQRKQTVPDEASSKAFAYLASFA